MFKISAETKQHKTEDPKKIAAALQTVFKEKVQERKVGDEIYLFIESNKYSSLDSLHELFRQQRILDVARKTLRKGTVENSTVFYINKQVAFVKKINFCDEEGESPLGPIRIVIEYEDIEKLIDWLTPFTKHGYEEKLVRKFP
ncbi:MAG: RNA-binding domain-containing protein [Candidatus Heimdallarchaeota archaeon]